MAGQIATVMGRSRALLTETDRQYIAGEADKENKQYQAVSRVRDRFDELERDIDVLAEHHPDLLNEIRDIVCEGSVPRENSCDEVAQADEIEGD